LVECISRLTHQPTMQCYTVPDKELYTLYTLQWSLPVCVVLSYFTLIDRGVCGVINRSCRGASLQCHWQWGKVTMPLQGSFLSADPTPR
jgi:hypothetical protein